MPRTPIKESERRRGRFEEQYGEGATELDALEALHPGTLQQILENEIERYFDASLNQRVQEVADQVGREIDRANSDAHAGHTAKIRALQDKWKAIEDEHKRQVREWQQQAKPIWRAISKTLLATDLDRIEWPEPNEPDEDDDPLFDSTREYVEQIDRYKQHQGKPIARRSRGGGAL